MKRMKQWEDVLCAAGFALCVLMTGAYLIVGYGSYLDSDMASELVLARQLVSERTLFSGQWYYSTEVRLLNTQLIFAPLMAVFGGSWRLVRTVGCMLLLAIMAVCCLYAALAMGARRPYALAFAGLSLCVSSPLYAQNVVVGAYYIPHAVLAFLMLGLYSRWLHGHRRREATALLLLAFVMGLSSIRYLLSSLLPMAGASLWVLVFPGEREEEQRTGAQIREAMLGLGIGAAGAVGYGAGKKLLPMYFHIDMSYYASVGYASFSLNDLGMQLQSVIYGLLHAMGFEDSMPLFGVQGIRNALVLLELLAAGLLVWRMLRRDREKTRRTGTLTLVFAFVLSLMSFVLLRSVYFDRYWLPVMMMGAPVMALCLSTEKNGVLRVLAMLLFAGTVLLGSISTMFYAMRNPQIERDGRTTIAQTAQEYRLSKGYATFWNANVLTEVSNGKVDVAAIDWVRDGGEVVAMQPTRWLETEQDYAMDRPDEPVFLLVGEWECEGIEPLLTKLQAQRVEGDPWIRFYIIPSQRKLFEAMAP